MKNIYSFLALIFLSFNSYSQTPCENGFAGPYPCNDYDLMSQIDLNTLSASDGNDSWGWTDPQDGKEYAIMGLTNGTAFIDISNPIQPVYLGKLPTHTQSSIWRDIKVYGNYAFIVSEAPGHGMQVFDLTRLRNVSNAPTTFTNDAHYDGFGRAHNIVINPEQPYAYAVGTTTYNGGPHIVDISNPLNPELAGGYSGSFYTHDAQVVTYNGPDLDYAGREIFLGNNADEVVFVDVTDKSNPVLISDIDYTNSVDTYTHQGWLTEDQRYFFLGDETDEIGSGSATRTIIFDLEDLDSPFIHQEYFGPTGAIDHNGYIKGDTFYLSNYTAGIRIIDISGVGAEEINEVGFFDTYPESNSFDFDGVWSNYPYFESGNIVVSDINRGFFLIRQSGTLETSNFQNQEFKIFPNPASSYVTVLNTQEDIQKIEIFNLLGQKIFSKAYQDEKQIQVNLEAFDSGLYLLKINNSFTRKLIIE
ncbi:choice-of-anchor B family protein [Psychroflexus gondwanensis]|uniref:choice-of-anchor B family protein n=1 Tax=Psychroflexus gondwanensis TaxID=251 RepID=UPI0011BE081B|nr:choice-of-anchor B family protein [Psychroflexus gondwanensis]TXE20708.1 choice-of-anchor B family protein [Psychroflexus gondwanensis]